MAERPFHTTCLRVWATAVPATLVLAAWRRRRRWRRGAARSRRCFAVSPVGTPGAVLLHGAAGRALRGSVSVRNLSRNRISVRLQRADIANASNGNASYITAGVRHTGRWLRLQTGTVRLAAHATRRVRYTIRIPRGTTGASHYAGIVGVNAAELDEAHAHPRHSRHSFNFHRIDRQAIPITIRLPGPLTRSLALRSVTLSVKPVGAAVMLGLAPGGSELIDSTAVKLHVLHGDRTIFTTATTLGQLFPGAPLAYRIPWKGRPDRRHVPRGRHDPSSRRSGDPCQREPHGHWGESQAVGAGHHCRRPAGGGRRASPDGSGSHWRSPPCC